MLLLPRRRVATAPGLLTTLATTTDQTSHTMSSVSCPVGRIVICFFVIGPTISLSSTVDGNSATLDQNSGAGIERVQIYSYDNPTAGDYDIVIDNGGNTIWRCLAGVYFIGDVSSQAGDDLSSDSSPDDLTANTNAGDTAVACAYVSDASFTGFVGSNGLPAAADFTVVIDSNHRFCGFLQTDAAGATPETFTIAEPGGGDINFSALRTYR